MSIINITDRLIAVEVPKDIRNVSVNKGLLTGEWRLLSDNYNPKYLKTDKPCSFEYICLTSEVDKHPYATFTDDEHEAISFITGEYALIRINSKEI